jgi:hypothetical protein
MNAKETHLLATGSGYYWLKTVCGTVISRREYHESLGSKYICSACLPRER